MKKYLILILVFFSLLANAQTAEDFAAKGRVAYQSRNYEESCKYFTKAAELGHDKACGMLASMYMLGFLPEGKNLDKAFMWANLGFGRGDISSANSIGMILFHRAKTLEEYDMAMELLEIGYNNGVSNMSGNLLCACYLKLGKFKEAEELADKIIAKTQGVANMAGSYADALAIKGLLYLKKDMLYVSMANGNESIKALPTALGYYVYGRSLIECDIDKQQGKALVKEASQYKSDSVLEINCFSDEIQKYWNTINN